MTLSYCPCRNVLRPTLSNVEQRSTITHFAISYVFQFLLNLCYQWIIWFDGRSFIDSFETYIGTLVISSLINELIYLGERDSIISLIVLISYQSLLSRTARLVYPSHGVVTGTRHHGPLADGPKSVLTTCNCPLLPHTLPYQNQSRIVRNHQPYPHFL